MRIEASHDEILLLRSSQSLCVTSTENSCGGLQGLDRGCRRPPQDRHNRLYPREMALRVDPTRRPRWYELHHSLDRILSVKHAVQTIVSAVSLFPRLFERFVVASVPSPQKQAGGSPFQRGATARVPSSNKVLFGHTAGNDALHP
jgi:hypothetical protein